MEALGRDSALWEQVKGFRLDPGKCPEARQSQRRSEVDLEAGGGRVKKRGECRRHTFIEK